MNNFGSSTTLEIESIIKKEVSSFLKKQSSPVIDKQFISDINQLISNCFKHQISPECNHRFFTTELREKIINLILSNTYDMTEEQVSVGLDRLVANCYIFPHTDEIYYIGPEDSNKLTPFSPNNFEYFFITKKETFQREQIFQAFLKYMQHIYTHNLKTAVEKRLYHLGYTSPLPFVRYNKSLFVNTNFHYNNATNKFVLLTHETLSFFLQDVLKLSYNSNTISLLLREFWNCFDFVDQSPSPGIDIISLPSNKIVKFSNEGGILELPFCTNSMQQAHFHNQSCFMKIPPQFPQYFLAGKEAFSAHDKSALYLLLGNSIDNLSHFSSLIAASYVSGKYINYPIVFFSNNSQNLCNIKTVLSAIFNNKISLLTKIEATNPEKNIDSLSQKLYAENAVAILETDDGNLDIDGLRKLTKRYIIRNGPVVIKNPLPVIIITSSISLCKKLNDKLDAKIIEVPTINYNINEFSPQISYARIRQSLLLYGLNNFSKRTTNLSKWAYKETLLENFFRDFIVYSETGYETKREIKNAFMNYVRKIDKTLNIKPIAICNYLMDRGYDGKKKKRTLNDKNPVGVIMNIELNFSELIQLEIKDNVELEFTNPEFSRLITLLENLNIAIPCSF